MKARRRLLAAALLLALMAVSGWWWLSGESRMRPKVDPRTFQSMTIYDLEGLDAMSVTEAELGVSTHVHIGPDETRAVFDDTTYTHREPIWKGSTLAVVRTSTGETHRIAISYYGGFFKLAGCHGVYQTRGASREHLDRLLHRVLVDEFVPARTRPAS